MSQENLSATRYLSVGAYLDPAFRYLAVRDVLGEEHTAVAPSHSIDIVPVLRHCLAAAARQRLLNGLVAAVVLLCLIVSFGQVLLLFSLGYGLLAGMRSLGGLLRRDALTATLYGLLAIVLLITASAAANNLLEDAAFGGSDTILGGTRRLLLTLLLALAGTTAVLVWYEISIHRTLLDELTEGRFRPEAAPRPTSPKHRARLAYLADAQHGNVTVYGRGRRDNPFLGCGPIVEAWSLAVPLEPDEETGREPEALTVQGLYRAMRVALVTLADPEVPEDQRIAGLSLQHRLFASGLLSPGHPLLEGGRHPRLRISQQQVDALSQDERSRATQLLTVRVNGWDGELDVTVLLYFSVRGNMLYTEFTACSLAPINAWYHVVDTLQQIGPPVYQRAVLNALVNAPAALVRCPLNLLRPAIAAIRRDLNVRGQIQRIASQLSFEYGATTSVRELGADPDTGNLFHNYDSDRYIKTVNRRVIDAISEVLTEHGWSNKDFLRRTDVYIDRSTNIMDSNLSNVAIASGAGARADNRGAPVQPAARPEQPARTSS